MLEIYESGVMRGMSGNYIGYVRSDGSIFKGGFNFEGGKYLGYFRGSLIYRGGWNGEGGQYLGSARWFKIMNSATVYKTQSGFVEDKDETPIGRVEQDGSLYGRGYILPDSMKYMGYVKNFIWDAFHAHGAGAAILLLLPE